MKDGLFEVPMIQHASGNFSFVGRMPVWLNWTNKDGTELTEEQAQEVAGCNMPAMIAKSRTFKTVTEAEKIANKYGATVSQVSYHN
jgi:hypothetical protein